MVLLVVTNQGIVTLMQVIHILLATAFAVGAVLSTVFTLQIPYTPTLVAKSRVMNQNSMVARFLIIPGSLLAGITGFVLAWIEGYGLQQRWVLFSLILFAIAFIVGGISGPMITRTRRLVEVEARSGRRPSGELVIALRSRTPLVLTGITLIVTVALIFLMFAKPV